MQAIEEIKKQDALNELIEHSLSEFYEHGEEQRRLYLAPIEKMKREEMTNERDTLQGLCHRATMNLEEQEQFFIYRAGFLAGMEHARRQDWKESLKSPPQ
ncbi:MAG: hypothetical protein RDV48_29070 [Candidatus Eremiobacteraeota bacterium]|nr:hypothetical protein [Candidatus Eremiobacteraeota bacterium]